MKSWGSNQTGKTARNRQVTQRMGVAKMIGGAGAQLSMECTELSILGFHPAPETPGGLIARTGTSIRWSFRGLLHSGFLNHFDAFVHQEGLAY